MGQLLTRLKEWVNGWWSVRSRTQPNDGLRFSQLCFDGMDVIDYSDSLYNSNYFYCETLCEFDDLDELNIDSDQLIELDMCTH